MENQVAGLREIWVCGACGKMSKDRYGDSWLSPGWDESCMMNALLCKEDQLVIKGGKVVEIKPLLGE